jgi:branched-chain amino acid transport system permease protein
MSDIVGARRRPLVNWWLFAISVIAIVALPLFVSSFYGRQLLIVVVLNVTLAMGLNLILGYTGQLALGHIAFYGIGAYTSAIMVMRYGLSFWLALIVATVFAGFAGWILSLFTLRLRGHYLAIATIGFNVITYQIILNWISVTRGPLGIPGVPAPSPISVAGITIDFFDKQVYFYLVAAFGLGVYLLLKAILRSPIGDALLAVREDEVSARSIGINPFLWKMFAFVLASALGGTAGSFYAHYLGILAPESFFVVESFALLAMVVVGGMGTMLGPVVGAVVLTLAPQMLRAVGTYRLVIFGAALTAVVLFFPSGLAGLARLRVRRPRLQAEPEAEREHVGGA